MYEMCFLYLYAIFPSRILFFPDRLWVIFQHLAKFTLRQETHPQLCALIGSVMSPFWQNGMPHIYGHGNLGSSPHSGQRQSSFCTSTAVELHVGRHGHSSGRLHGGGVCWAFIGWNFRNYFVSSIFVYVVYSRVDLTQPKHTWIWMPTWVEQQLRRAKTTQSLIVQMKIVFFCQRNVRNCEFVSLFPCFIISDKMFIRLECLFNVCHM